MSFKSALSIVHCCYGGYIVYECHKPGSGYQDMAMAAFTSIEEALRFIKTHIVKDKEQ